MNRFLFFSLVLAFLSACAQKKDFEVTTFLSDTPFIPLPKEVTNDSSYLVIGQKLNIELGNLNITPTIQQISDYWETQNFADEALSILFQKSEELKNEAYELVISPDQITIRAQSHNGFYWGWITLKQILVLNQVETAYGPAIPTGKILDIPQYGYRGMMLDIARHFFSPSEIKMVINEITHYKINRLHLHLADDQGWRIQINSWPQLTEIGGSVEVGSSLEPEKRQGGYLTQEEYKDLVSYAEARGIMIIPEIDMPGHTNAALASYAELNCDGKARQLYTGTEVGFSTLCTDKEITYQFIGDVVREISEITPGPYFHIGGDESHATDHADYLYFINRVIDTVQRYNKTMMGWDEIAEADVNANTVVQLWAHPEMAETGLQKDASILFSLANRTYLDMKYDSTTALGLNWAGYIDLSTAYQWDPTDYLSEEYVEQFLGLEAPLWSETVTNVNEIEYMLFPRITAYAEIGWTNKQSRSWEDYLKRVQAHESWWKYQSINNASIASSF
jgi:hexosaminidase